MEIGLERSYRRLLDRGVEDIEEGKYVSGLAECFGFALLPGSLPVLVDNIAREAGNDTSMGDYIFGYFMQVLPVDMAAKGGLAFTVSDAIVKYMVG